MALSGSTFDEHQHFADCDGLARPGSLIEAAIRLTAHDHALSVGCGRDVRLHDLRR